MKLTSSAGLVGLSAILLSAAVGWSVGRNQIVNRRARAETAEAPQLASLQPTEPVPIVAQPSPPASLQPSTARPQPESHVTSATPRQIAQPSSGVLIVVSLASQRAFVFKDGMPWGSSRVSTGKAGKRTPVGRFTILEKRLTHRSNKYSNAPMPYMQRITWQGVALHAGRVPGYPASHGCIRLPREFAKNLYALTNNSSVVVVTSRHADSAKQARKLS